MDPITTMVVSALALGAAAGLKPTAEQAVKDAYAALKALIQRKYANVSLAQLEEAPESESRRAVVEEDLAKTNAGEDEELLRQAKELLDTIQTHAPEAAGAIGIDLEDIILEGGKRVIHTGGGAYVQGQVSTGGGDFVGRDQIKTTSETVGLSAAEVAELFKPLYATIESRPNTSSTDVADLNVELHELQDEIAEGETANEESLARRLRNFQRMAPDILDVVLATLANPVAGFGEVVKKVVGKMKREAGEEE
ncbi:MAG: hypothetical protein IIA89_05000 [Chloroflexi bacterium]|nr:hypothetical protein [Chloroflexota bacterium]